MDWIPIARFIKAFTFGYPFVMAWYWMVGGVLYHWLRGRHEPRPENPPTLPEYPPVSILLPCHNEEAQAEETLGVLSAIEFQTAWASFFDICSSVGRRRKTRS